MAGDPRRDEFGEDFDPAPPPDGGFNGHARAWRLTHLAARPWPNIPVADRCDTNGRLIIQHRVTGRVRVVTVTCRTWGCPGCGGRKAKEVLEKLGAHWKPETGIWWAWGAGRTERDRLRKQLARSHSDAHVWVRRRETFHLFADGPLGGGRHLDQPEALLVARFALRLGVVRSWGPWLAADLDPLYRRLDFASAQATRIARDRAEQSILSAYGVAYSFDEADPPAGFANRFAAEFLAALETSRTSHGDDVGGDHQ